MPTFTTPGCTAGAPLPMLAFHAEGCDVGVLLSCPVRKGELVTRCEAEALSLDQRCCRGGC